MSTRSEDENGYIRITSDDGRTSRLYEPPSSFLGQLFGIPGNCIEVADHHDDGTTTAYEYEPGLINSIFNNDRGDRK